MKTALTDVLRLASAPLFIGVTVYAFLHLAWSVGTGDWPAVAWTVIYVCVGGVIGAAIGLLERKSRAGSVPCGDELWEGE